jgi:hypothetical protein
MAVNPLGRRSVAPIVERAELAALAVETGRGPHLTPSAFSVADGRIWLVAARSTVKVRAIRRRPAVSVLIRAGERSVVVTGEATVLSPWGAGDAVALAADSWHAADAMLRYAVRNRRLLAGYTRDLLGCQGGALPFDRVVIVVRPRRGLVLHGGRIADRWGRWSRQAAGVARAVADHGLDLDGVPARAATAWTRGAAPALAWSLDAGPLALPARRRSGQALVEVPALALDLAGAPPESRAAVAMAGADLRPSRVSGVMARGRGRVVRRRGGAATVGIHAERVTWWSGLATGTVDMPAQSRRSAA